MHRAVAVLDATVGFVFSLDEKLNVQSFFTFGVEVPAPELLLREPPDASRSWPRASRCRSRSRSSSAVPVAIC